MANCGKEILITREGTEQQNRFVKALDPNYFQLNEFGLKDWMQFAFNFAKHVNYFETSNNEVPQGDWADFFINVDELDVFLDKLDERNDINPHLALYISFIKLIEFTKKRFNKLSYRHLDYYYREILKIDKLPATPDKVHLIFELAKNSTEVLISENTNIDGGKDNDGKKRLYKTTANFVANKVTVSELKSIYYAKTENVMKAAAVANSLDGIGAAFKGDDVTWWPFGFYDKLNDTANSETADSDIATLEKSAIVLPDAQLGFALASEVLYLSEGERNIHIEIDFEQVPGKNDFNDLISGVEVYCTGEKKWLGPYKLISSISDAYYKELDSNQKFSSGYDLASGKLHLSFQISKGDKALCGYSFKTHQHRFNTTHPVCRILFKAASSLYTNLLAQKIKGIRLDVDVKGIKSIDIENDNGKLNADKPFYPFTTIPLKRSKFYINYPELVKKNWTDLKINIDWKNTPENASNAAFPPFVNLYYAYRTGDLPSYTASSFMLKYEVNDLLETREVTKEINDKLKPDSGIRTNLPSYKYEGKAINPPSDLIIKSDSDFMADVEIFSNEKWIPVQTGFSLFTPDDKAYKAVLNVVKDNYIVDGNGLIRLSLNQTFLHEMFPRIYAKAINDTTKLIPNEPYTPIIDSIELSYTASSTAQLSKTLNDYQNTPLRIFHEHPFGQTEEHKYLKAQNGIIENDKIATYLVPNYCEGGELLIGLKGANTLQQVSLLVQVNEGSENPDSDSFVGNEKVEWSVLCNNEWMSLDSSHMISNETDNFLKSGLIQFSIPGEATNNNTLLEPNLFWIKAKMYRKYDVVCKAFSITAQAVLAEFHNNGNNLAHLENGLTAKTISKLIKRIPEVKSISQPYSSFDGVPKETDEVYYRRVSERLRHKNRAITIWDYENIILQQFPYIHKVKCLSHSKENEFLKPGEVLIVVIPDIINKNVFDIYQPRVSRAKLNSIMEYINKLNSLHVETVVINPDYEVVTVELKVKFLKGYDESYYKKVLNTDIIKLLSPWAFEKTASINFGVELHKSIVIKYVEELSYVDYVQDVELFVDGVKHNSGIAPSSPKAILVSSKQHILSTNISQCINPTEPKVPCQN